MRKRQKTSSLGVFRMARKKPRHMGVSKRLREKLPSWKACSEKKCEK